MVETQFPRIDGKVICRDKSVKIPDSFRKAFTNKITDVILYSPKVKDAVLGKVLLAGTPRTSAKFDYIEIRFYDKDGRLVAGHKMLGWTDL